MVQYFENYTVCCRFKALRLISREKFTLLHYTETSYCLPSHRIFTRSVLARQEGDHAAMRFGFFHSACAVDHLRSALFRKRGAVEHQLK